MQENKKTRIADNIFQLNSDNTEMMTNEFFGADRFGNRSVGNAIA